MNATITAHADQLHAEVRDARARDGHAESCDALDPCESCKAKTAEVRKARRAGSVPTIPVPRKPSSALQNRLRAARA